AAALDAAIGQIEGSSRHIDKGVIAIDAVGGKHGRGKATLAALQTGIEAGIAATVGLGGGQHLVVAGDQTKIDVDNRSGRRQRTDEHVYTVIAIDAGETKIGNDEPLGGRSGAASILLGADGVGY